MPIKLTVNVRGDVEIRKAIGKLRKPESKAIFERSLRRSAELVAKTAGPLAPRKSGALSQSYRAKVAKGKSADVAWDAGTPLKYAPPHEFGWPGKGIRAQPSLQPALARSESRFADIWVEEMDRELGNVRSAGGVVSR